MFSASAALDCIEILNIIWEKSTQPAGAAQVQGKRNSLRHSAAGPSVGTRWFGAGIAITSNGAARPGSSREKTIMTNTAKPVKKEKKLGAKKLENKTTLEAQRPLLVVR
jgi:hypothetical protein